MYAFVVRFYGIEGSLPNSSIPWSKAYVIFTPYPNKQMFPRSVGRRAIFDDRCMSDLDISWIYSVRTKDIASDQKRIYPNRIKDSKFWR